MLSVLCHGDSSALEWEGMSSSVVVWVPPNQRPDFLAEQKRKADLKRAQAAEIEAREEAAKAKAMHTRMMSVGRELVLTHLEKLLRLSQSPDFQDSQGPVEMKDLIKLAEVVAKDHRLVTGQSTENIAHAVRASVDFARMTDEERAEWRRLAMKGGAVDE